MGEVFQTSIGWQRAFSAASLIIKYHLSWATVIDPANCLGFFGFASFFPALKSVLGFPEEFARTFLVLLGLFLKNLMSFSQFFYHLKTWQISLFPVHLTDTATGQVFQRQQIVVRPCRATVQGHQRPWRCCRCPDVMHTSAKLISIHTVYVLYIPGWAVEIHYNNISHWKWLGDVKRSQGKITWTSHRALKNVSEIQETR